MRFLPRPPSTINAHRYLELNLLKSTMDKKIGLFWLRDDFRVTKNDGLIEATRNHNQVVVFYLYKEEFFKAQEAQKCWISISLLSFRKQLNSFNINLKIVKTNSFKTFFDNLVKKKISQFIGTKFTNQIT